jgi:hypothetical protein
MNFHNDLASWNLAHAAMMGQPTDGLVTGSAHHVGARLNGSGEGIQRCPVPRTGWTENSDGWRTDRRRHVLQSGIIRHGRARKSQCENGVAEIRRGEIMGMGTCCPDDF